MSGISTSTHSFSSSPYSSSQVNHKKSPALFNLRPTYDSKVPVCGGEGVVQIFIATRVDVLTLCFERRPKGTIFGAFRPCSTASDVLDRTKANHDMF